jgi:ssDNA-binding Zn-finger/Zn-ribbon topoisomerase 1
MLVALTGTCPLCSRDLRVRRRRADNEPFVGCSGYPNCSYTTDYDVALEQLHDELEQLHDELERVRGHSSAPASVHRQLRDLVFRFHPDRAGAAVSTTEVVAALNDLLDQTRK